MAPARSDSAFARRSRFLAAGGAERNLQQTLEDVLADERARGLDRERRSGLTEDEQRLLLDETARRNLAMQAYSVVPRAPRLRIP